MSDPGPPIATDVAAVVSGLASYDYLADEGLATAVFLALRLQRPLFLEGDAGVGKTEIAKALAAWTGGQSQTSRSASASAVIAAKPSPNLKPIKVRRVAGAAGGAYMPTFIGVDSPLIA